MLLELKSLPKSKAEAMALGVRHFFTGSPCSRGHVAKRYASTGQCTECQYLHRLNWKSNNPEKEAESRLQSVRAWTLRNPDRKRDLARKSNAKPDVSANNVARARRWRDKNPEQARNSRLVSNRNRRSRKRGAEGTHVAEDIANILKRQKYRCAECGVSVRKIEQRHVDHIAPLALGGSNWPSNLQILCPACNLHKAAKDPLVFARQKGRLI